MGDNPPMPKQTPTHSDFKGLADWVEVFRAGGQTDSQGRTRTFTQADLDQVVANHDPAHPAPHVITHKELYSPFAYAQAAELKREGDSLYLKSKNVEPQFEKLIQDGRLYERSVRLLPTPKGWKLGHIAWLGAEPPAVEGMAPVSFSADAAGFDFTMDSQTPNILARMMRNMRDFLIEQFGKDKADAVMPEWDIEFLNRHAQRLEDDAQTLQPDFSKPPTGDGAMLDFTQADIDAAKKAAREEAAAEFSQQQTTLQTQLATERAERLRAGHQALIDSHIQRGVKPAALAGAVDFMMQLDSGDAGAFEFSAGGDPAATVKTSQLDFVKGLLNQLPATVKTGESDAGQELPADAAAEFNAPRGTHVDVDGLALHQKALDYQLKHPGTDYLTAVRTVEKQEKR